MTDAPKRIWLQDDGDYEGARNSMAGTDTGVTWADNPINDNDSEYIRADLVPRWSSDMDAAPKDGTPILVAAEDCNVGEASFIDGEWWWSSQACAVCWPVESSNGPVTHWMPLPDPPKEGE